MSQVRDLLRFVWSEPRAPHPPGLRKRDGVLLGVLLAIGLVEGVLRPDLSWTSPALVVSLALVPTLLWRRSRPLLVVSIAFSATTAIELARLVTGRELPAPGTMIYLLLVPYSLFRWGSGREVVVGLVIMLFGTPMGFIVARAPASDVTGGVAVLLSAIALGMVARYRDRARAREIEQVKLREREQLARDLHDTVAHHVSAIAIRAQAGLATSPARPEAAIDALRIIETEASRTLTEMRAMVRFLRHDRPVQLAPNPRVVDLERLARPPAEGPDVDVEIAAGLDDLSPSVSAAVYRLAQESITNARRHARHATRIKVGVTADEASVHLRVSDDGDLDPARSSGSVGYGLVGMTERAEQLGGTLHAGPDPRGGWTVTAVLPRKGAVP